MQPSTLLLGPHSGWLDNRFVASGGQTALERASDRAYSGKLATFGEDILVYLAVHVVGTSEGVFLTRSIRRSAGAFNLNRFAELENYPWEFGLAGLGNKLVHNKRLTRPLYPVVQVQKQLELKLLLALRADEQSLPAESQKKPRAAIGVPFDDDDDDDDDILDDSEVGQHVPKTPTLEDDVFKQNISAVTSTDLDLYEHEDEQVRVSLENPELDSLEEYDMEFYDDEWLEADSCDDNAAMQKLMFPFTKHEPDRGFC